MTDLADSFRKYMVDNEERVKEPLKVLRTRSWGLHHVMTTGGVPMNHAIEIYGPPKIGKTTLTNFIIGEAQRKYPNRKVAYVDVENKYDLAYAVKCGVKANDSFTLYQSLSDDPENYLYGEQALDMVINFVRSREYSVVVLDSIGGLTMKNIFDSDLTAANMGLEARILTRAMKSLNIVRQNSDTIILLLNQIRSGMGGGFSYETTPGGNALAHLISMKLRVGKSKGGDIKYQGRSIGYHIQVLNKFNSLGESGRSAEIPLIFYKGVYPPIELLLAARELKLVSGTSSFKLKLNGKEYSLGRGVWAASKSITQHRKKLYPMVYKLLQEKERKLKIIE